MSGPQAALLPDGRLHLQHGPIDLVIGIVAAADEAARAQAQAEARFRTVLAELVEELQRLRSPCPPSGLGLAGPVARRMEAAVRPHAGTFVTPMAAVAGAVADEVLAALAEGRTLRRAYVNDGGDIAFLLAPGEAFTVGLVADPRDGRVVGRLAIAADDPPRGIATSGRHGRSLSLGIADAVTVVAATAAAADAAATLIANAVDLPGSAKVSRVAARDLDPDSDLGDRPVTVDVAPLARTEVMAALARGADRARTMRTRGLIAAAALCLDGEVSLVGDDGRITVEAQSPAGVAARA